MTDSLSFSLLFTLPVKHKSNTGLPFEIFKMKTKQINNNEKETRSSQNIYEINFK